MRQDKGVVCDVTGEDLLFNSMTPTLPRTAGVIICKHVEFSGSYTYVLTAHMSGGRRDETKRWSETFETEAAWFLPNTEPIRHLSWARMMGRKV